MPFDLDGNWIEPEFGGNNQPDPGDIEDTIDWSNPDQDFENETPDLVGEGTGTYSGNLELDYRNIVEEFFPDVFNWDVAHDKDDWWERYGAYFHDYDPFEEDAAKKQRSLDVSKWQEKMLRDKKTLEHASGAGGFVTSSNATEYEDTLTKLGSTEFLEGALSTQLEVYNFQKDWQEETIDQVNELSQLGAFAEAEGGWGGSCSSDSDCQYEGICIGNMCRASDAVAGCTDTSACNYNEHATENDGSCEYADIENGFECGDFNDGDGDGIADDIYPGCTDPDADNYNPDANSNDGTCAYESEGKFEEEIPYDPSLDDIFEIINCEDGGGTWWPCEDAAGCCGGGTSCCGDEEEGDGDISDCASTWPEDACLEAGGAGIYEDYPDQGQYDVYTGCSCPSGDGTPIN